MEKKKAIVCTILYIIVLTFIITGSMYVKNVDGISLYQLIMCVIGSMWIGHSVVKFYNWLIEH